MELEKKRTIYIFKNYFTDFIAEQKEEVKNKIIWVFRIIETQPTIPKQYFKHIQGTKGLYEIRIQFGNNSLRIFCFFDKGNIIILANGFHKKTNKTPVGTIKKAIKIQKEYEAAKDT